MQLQGKWRKTSQEACAAVYPDEIEFTPKGLYFGRKGEGGGEFTIWDVGRYEAVSTDRVKLSTANDAEITYACSATNDALVFTAPDGCQIRYQRAV